MKSRIKKQGVRVKEEVEGSEEIRKRKEETEIDSRENVNVKEIGG